ncbi:tyrosine aminotransferase-like [Chenopodium quinoa]|uniref:tyrosine aminotransferase-like n=1 Tax=Chenopodium quinoa TaxID=63459 RepID=UPI000B76F0D9|nr:tyrosine aminotransferase-like [Chenopodium quinoa]
MENNGRMLWRYNKEEKHEEIDSGDKKKPLTVRTALGLLLENIDPNDERTLVPMGHGDPSPFQCFRTAATAEDAVVATLRSATSNCYATTYGLPPARKAVADYISKDLPYKLSADDIHLTAGCKQAIQLAITSLATPGSNILLPKPTFAMYDAAAAYTGLKVQQYDLLPERGWEVDIDSVEALADSNTVAIVVINPGNPSGSVYTRQHLQKVAETARKLGLLVIADEVYEHITFGTNPFVRMGEFASIVPMLTVGSLSKRWLVPGWRLGWLVTTDPTGFLQKSQFIKRVRDFISISPEPATFIQAAVPQILQNTKQEFFSKCIDVLRLDADIIYEKLKEIPCITCPSKPEGSMFIMVKLNVFMLDGILDDADFCLKLAKQEKVILLPGSTVGMENWLRITCALDPSVLEEGLDRIKAFCQRNAKAH